MPGQDELAAEIAQERLRFGRDPIVDWPHNVNWRSHVLKGTHEFPGVGDGPGDKPRKERSLVNVGQPGPRLLVQDVAAHAAITLRGHGPVAPRAHQLAHVIQERASLLQSGGVGPWTGVGASLIDSLCHRSEESTRLNSSHLGISY